MTDDSRKTLSGTRNPGPLIGRLLVVEPDELVRRMLAMSLHSLGHVVLTAESSEAARDEIASEPFDLIVLDADADGSSYWRDLMINGVIPQHMILSGFSASPENIALYNSYI